MDLSTNRDLDIDSRPDIQPMSRSHQFLNEFHVAPTEGDILTLHNKIQGYKAYSNKL